MQLNSIKSTRNSTKKIKYEDYKPQDRRPIDHFFEIKNNKIYGFGRDLLGIYITSGEITEPENPDDCTSKQDTIGKPDSPWSAKSGHVYYNRPNVSMRMKYVDGFSIRYEGQLDLKAMEMRGK